MLTPALATLLDDARAEAKRAGHPAASPLHLAAALARRSPAEFDAAFGSGGRERLAKALAAGALTSGVEAETVAVLEAAGSDDPAAVLAVLRARVPELVDGTGAPAPAAPAPSSPAAAPAGPARDPLLERVGPDPSIVGFDGLVDELIALLSMRTPSRPLVHGPAGSGKTSVAAALATRLRADGYAGPLKGSAVTRIATAAVLSEDPIAALDHGLDAAAPSDIVIVDDLESLLSLGSSATVLPMLARLRGAASDTRRRIVLIVDEAYTSRLDATDQELTAFCTSLEVPALPVEQLWEIARVRASELAAHHSVEIPDAVVRLAASPRAGTDRLAHPGLLRERLDRAAARAAMRAGRTVTEHDLGLAANAEIAPLDAATLVTALHDRIRGQDDALAPVAARLALTRARLDLRPERPDGVFLFVGPTGVGKTELARALCERLFGDEQRLVRLDMSEYSEPWALSRLIGPQPGYVGYTEPESWLTTRIRKQRDTVLLLDEIEKAHPSVWNAFLQVFDAGRLTDAQGNIATFDLTVIVMTSNLGSREADASPVGFAPAGEDELAERGREQVMDAVRESMPPELINRLDEIVLFRPLSEAAIAEIAQLEIDRLRGRLTERGYVVEIAPAVVALVAQNGYDPAFGARHLQRNIERLLLEPLAGVAERELVADVADGKVVWRPAA